jgi:Na+-driven multidrug efflux pump
LWYILSGRNLARLRPTRLRWPLFREILRIGAVASLTSIQTNIIIGGATALVASAAGSVAVAGFGTAARLEFLLIPLVFGLGAPLVALVGTNVGAGNRERALRIGLIGAAIAFSLTETIGIMAALFPQTWLNLFSTDPRVVEVGVTYLRVVGPFYGFFGLGLSLYFASQGAGRLFWPLVTGTVRLLIALVGGWLALRLGGSLISLFVLLAIGLAVYGLSMLAAVASGAWFASLNLASHASMSALPPKSDLGR